MTEDAIDDVNPYRSPASAAANEQTLVSFVIRTTLFLVALVGHLYFWLMLRAWTLGLLYGPMQWTTTRAREFTMFGFASVCLVATGTILVAVGRSANKLAFLATVVSLVSFGTLALASSFM